MREERREREKEGAVGERGGRRVEEEKEEDGESWRELGRRRGGGEGRDQRYEDRRENFLHRYIAPLVRRHIY